MKNILVIYLGILVFLSVGSQGVFAVTTSLSNVPNIIEQSPFNVTVSIIGAKVAKNYLRVDIYKEGTSEYTGQTFNGAEWYDGEDATRYFPIDITGPETNIATISAQLSTLPASWSSQDTFRIRVRRYTASGSYTSSEADTSSLPVFINIPSPTPAISPSSTPSPTPSLATAPSPIPTNSFNPLSLIRNIYITEAMVAPETGQNEWIELYNNTNEVVTLNNWYIDDIENGGSSPQQFSVTIEPHSYSIVELSNTLFNNDGDSVRLLNSLQVQEDYFSYTITEKGKSIGRNDINSRSTCIELPSKDQTNTNCITPEVVSSARQRISTPEVQGESINISSSEGELDETFTSAEVTTIPLNRPIIGDKSLEPTPINIQTELNSPLLNRIFPTSNPNKFIKVTASSSAGISLLNIVYILYRMKKWYLPEM